MRNRGDEDGGRGADGGTRGIMRNIGELVLIHYQDQPAVYARIEAVEPDIKRDWYQVKLLLLTIPAQEVTWILREAYVDGAPFTMGGQNLWLELLRSPPKESGPQGKTPAAPPEKGETRRGTVIPFRNPRR